MKNELMNQIEYARNEIRQGYKKLMNKEIDRTEFNQINAMWSACIEYAKKELGADYQVPTVEGIKSKGANTKIDNEDGLKEEIAELEEELRYYCKKRVQEVTGAYNDKIKSINEEIKALKEKLAKQYGIKEEGFTTEEVKAVVVMIENSLVQEIEVKEVKTVEPMKNSTNIKIAKKHQNKIDEIFKEYEGYWVYLKEGYIFESMECGAQCFETQKELLEGLKDIKEA